MNQDLHTLINQNSDFLLQETGWGDVQGEEREQILESLSLHFTKLILETTIVHLPEDKVKDFEQAFEVGDEAKIAELTAQIPGFDEILETAIAEEIKTIKAVNQEVKL